MDKAPEYEESIVPNFAGIRFSVLYFIVERRFDVLKQAFKLNAFDGTGFVFLS